MKNHKKNNKVYKNLIQHYIIFRKSKKNIYVYKFSAHRLSLIFIFSHGQVFLPHFNLHVKMIPLSNIHSESFFFCSREYHTSWHSHKLCDITILIFALSTNIPYLSTIIYQHWQSSSSLYCCLDLPNNIQHPLQEVRKRKKRSHFLPTPMASHFLISHFLISHFLQYPIFFGLP